MITLSLILAGIAYLRRRWAKRASAEQPARTEKP
jgi:hypothetical protein